MICKKEQALQLNVGLTKRLLFALRNNIKLKNIIPKRTIIFGLKSIVVIFFTAMLFACENQMETIRELTMADTIPSEIAKDVHIIYSDSAKIQMILTAPLLYQIGGEDPYIEFPNGLKIKTYDKNNKEISELQAEYGKRFQKSKLMEVERNVIVTNYNSGKKLLTEHLFWDEKKKKIYNNVFVTIIEKDKTIHGDSLKANQSFEYIKIFNVRGTINVKDDEIN
ncbi:MAG: LPS export ABC transporter periplasmic protein LptC [Bacteroidetes bacterium]|nr:MAG: LPS export ABC transporter periplasmic protein LptC [Bacteroidota bacterium]